MVVGWVGVGAWGTPTQHKSDLFFFFCCGGGNLLVRFSDRRKKGNPSTPYIYSYFESISKYRKSLFEKNADVSIFMISEANGGQAPPKPTIVDSGSTKSQINSRTNPESFSEILFLETPTVRKIENFEQDA